MKKKLTRMLAVLLIAMMLIPTIAALATTAHAAGTTDVSKLVNQYNTATELKNAVPNAEYYNKTLSLQNHRSSAPFAVSAGQTIYFGPCDPTQQWFFALYSSTDSSAKQTRKQIMAKEIKVEATFSDGSAICSYTVPNGYVAAAYAHKITPYNHPTLITLDVPFDVGEYFAYADLKGWDLVATGLRKETAAEPDVGFEGLWNYFPRKEDRNPLLRQHANNTFISSAYIKVTAGDTLCIGALNLDDYLKKPTKDSEHHVLTLFDKDYNSLSTVMLKKLELVENIGYGYGIYQYKIPVEISGTAIAYAKVDVHEGIYNDGDMLVTKNQPFTGEELRKTLGIAELSEEAKAHPFYGKKALFIGDSISYGSYDTPPTYRNPSASWARRLALATGLIPTNVSYPGASLGKTSSVKWANELLTPEVISKRTYDMIVFHGGVNDARQGVAVGEALSSDTPRKDLTDKERLATFAGGLQLMLHDARERWPEAELYYVANFKLVSSSLKGRDLNDYLTQAKILCAEYGVHYIDLFDDEILYETFDYTSTNVLSADLIHPSGPSYDILFPTILRLFNETIVENENSPEEDDENENENTNTPDEDENQGNNNIPNEDPTPVVPDNGENNNNVSEEPQQPISLSSILGIATTLLLLPLGWLFFPIFLLILIL